MASIRGLQTSGNGPSASKIVDMSKLYELEMDATPLIALTQKLKKTRTVENSRFDSQAIRPLAQYTLAASYLSGAATFVVADSTIFSVNDTLANMRTHENFIITAINYSTHTLTVTNIGTTVAAAGNTDDVVVRMGQALPEGSSIPTANVAQEDHTYNYTQIVRESYQISGTQQATANYTGDQEKLKIRQVSRKVKEDLEFRAFFGERGITNSGTIPCTKTAGLLSQITTNSYSPSGTMTRLEFEAEVLMKAGRYGSTEKILFAGEKVLQCLDFYGAAALHTLTQDTIMGFKCLRYRSSFLDLVVVRHKAFRDPSTAGMAFVVDPENIQRVAMKGRDLKLFRNRQANDFDGIYGELMGEIGFEFPLEETHMWIYGVAGPA